MASTLHTDVFELTSNTALREYETLVNDPLVTITASKEFFGIGGGAGADAGAEPMIYRVVDYTKKDGTSADIYPMPMS